LKSQLSRKVPGTSDASWRAPTPTGTLPITGSFNNVPSTIAPQVVTNPSQSNQANIQNSKMFSIPREKKGSLDFSRIATPPTNTPGVAANPTSNAHKRLFSWLGANKATPNQNEQVPK